MPREKGRREDILVAATGIFGSKGYHQANIGDIAEKAGIGKGTVYEYFSSKNELFIEAIKYNAELYSQRMEKQVSSQTAFMDKIYTFIECHREIVNKNVKSAGILLINPGDVTMTDESRKEVFNFLCAVRERTAGLLAEILKQGLEEELVCHTDVDFAADMLLEMLLRSCMRGVLANLSDREIKLENDKLLDLFMLGAGNREKYNRLV